MAASFTAIRLLAGAIASLLNPRGIAQHLTFFTSSSEAAIWRVRDKWRAFDPFAYDPEHESLGWLDWLATDALLVLLVGTIAHGAIALAREPPSHATSTSTNRSAQGWISWPTRSSSR